MTYIPIKEELKKLRGGRIDFDNDSFDFMGDFYRINYNWEYFTLILPGVRKLIYPRSIKELQIFIDVLNIPKE